MGIRSSLGVGVLALSLYTGSALAASPATAPSQRNVIAARGFVAALTRLDQTALARRGRVTAAARAYIAQVKAGCAGSLPAGVINGTKRQQSVAIDLVIEAASDLTDTATQSLNAPELAMARSVARLHFTKRSLNRAMRMLSEVMTLGVALAPSHLCLDIKTAAATGFDSDPPGTTTFLKKLNHLLALPGLNTGPVLNDLKPDLTSARDRAAIKRLVRLDAKANTFLDELGQTWGAKLGSVLTSPAPQPPAGGSFPTNPSGPAPRMMAALAGP